MAEQGFSRITFWEVWNFMSIKHARCDFDERNIINLKGYNDSGKSAMLTALKVCLTNSNPTKQVSFITDDEDYFRVLVGFSDGVILMRDKYRNGQSLYELYRGNDLIYTTKMANGALTRISEVPEPIAQYLGLIDYDKSYLNFRSCFEKQLGVQTTGSENYKMFNTVLKSEEIATAATLLNNDKNKLLSDINSVDSELTATKNLLGVGQYITSEEIDYMKSHDNELDKCETRLNAISIIRNLNDEINTIQIAPKIEGVDDKELTSLADIISLSNELSKINISPEVTVIDDTQIKSISDIRLMFSEFNKISVAPIVPDLNSTQLETLKAISNIIENIEECNDIITGNENRLKQLQIEVEDLQRKSEELGVKMVRCPNCGEVFNSDNAHVH